MQSGSCLTEAMMAEEVVQHTDNCIRPLAHITGLINYKIDLAWNGFTADPKDGCLPRCKEVVWAGL